MKQDILFDGMAKIIGNYAKDIDTFKSLLKTTTSVPNEVEFMYRALVNKKQIVPIENFQEKERIWNEVKGWKMSKEQKIKCAKSLYLIEIIRQ